MPDRIVSPNPSVVGLPGPYSFDGTEWMNFRQGREGVTAPVATVIGQAIKATPALATQIAALGSSGGATSSTFTPAPTVYRSAIGSSAMSAVMMPDSATPFAQLAGLPGAEIIVDPRVTYQTMVGFGAALTESTCFLLSKYCTPAQRKAILTQTFVTDGLSMARLCAGTSDFTWRAISGYYTYADNDTLADPTLPNFSIANDQEYIIPIAREVLACNPGVKFFLSPWSPPALAKDNGALIGGNLISSAPVYTALANYYVKAIQSYASFGIPMWGMTLQNEGGYVPSSYLGCKWTGVQAAAVVNVLGPAMAAAGVDDTRIMVGDHNWAEMTGYSGANGDLVLTPLQDATAGQYVSDIAFHGYDTENLATNNLVLTRISDQVQKVGRTPTKGLHITEYCAQLADSISDEMDRMFGNLAIAAVRQGAQSITLWNLFLDVNGMPTPSLTRARGCAAISTDGNATITKYPAYAMLQHMAKAFPQGTKRSRCNTFAMGWKGNDVMAVSGVRPDGSEAAVLYNGTTNSKVVALTHAPSGMVTFVIIGAKEARTVVWNIPAGSVATGSVQAPNPVTNFAATSANGVNTLTWTAPASANPSGIGGYAFLRSTVSGAETTIIGGARATDTQFVDTDVVIGTKYFYVPITLGAGGTAQGAEASVTTAASAPGAPTIVAVPGNGQNTINLTKAAAPNGSAITQYNLYRSTTAGGEGVTPYQSNVTFTNGQYVDSGTTNGTPYYYTLGAVNGVGPGPQSAESSAVLAKPGPVLLQGDDMGAAIGGASSSVPVGGWSNTTAVFASSGNASAVITNHNTINDPANNATASTIELKQTSAASGYASIECATIANDSTKLPGTGLRRYGCWLRGHTGGETLQLAITDSTRKATVTPAAAKQITLTTSWAYYYIDAAISLGATNPALFEVGCKPNAVGDYIFDACWASAA